MTMTKYIPSMWQILHDYVPSGLDRDMSSEHSERDRVARYKVHGTFCTLAVVVRDPGFGLSVEMYLYTRHSDKPLAERQFSCRKGELSYRINIGFDELLDQAGDVLRQDVDLYNSNLAKWRGTCG